MVGIKEFLSYIPSIIRHNCIVYFTYSTLVSSTAVKVLFNYVIYFTHVLHNHIILHYVLNPSIISFTYAPGSNHLGLLGPPLAPGNSATVGPLTISYTREEPCSISRWNFIVRAVLGGEVKTFPEPAVCFSSPASRPLS